MKNKAVYLLASLLWLSCSKYNDSEVDVNQSFTLSVTDTANIRNDGISSIGIVLSKTLTVRDGLTAKFETTKGILSIDNLQIDNLGSTKVFLKADQDTGTYQVKVSVKEGDNVKVQKLIRFSLRPAMPDNFYLETDSYKLDLSTPLGITTYLQRKTGKVTKQTTVNVSAFYAGTTTPVGRFTGLANNGSDGNGMLSTIKFYSDPNIDTSKVITIQFDSFNDAGSGISKQLNLRYH